MANINIVYNKVHCIHYIYITTLLLIIIAQQSRYFLDLSLSFKFLKKILSFFFMNYAPTKEHKKIYHRLLEPLKILVKTLH